MSTYSIHYESAKSAIEHGIYVEQHRALVSEAEYEIHDDWDGKRLGRPRLGAVTQGDMTGGFDAGLPVEVSPRHCVKEIVEEQEKAVTSQFAGRRGAVLRVINNDRCLCAVEVEFRTEDEVSTHIFIADDLCLPLESATSANGTYCLYSREGHLENPHVHVADCADGTMRVGRTLHRLEDLDVSSNEIVSKLAGWRLVRK